MPVNWRPKTSRLEDAIAEEQDKIDAIERKKQWLTKPVSPVVSVAPQLSDRLPVSADYQPPQLPSKVIPTVDNQDRLPVSEDYIPPQLPPMRQVMEKATPTQVISPSIPMPPESRKALWEQPAVWGEKLQTGIGQGISKLPFAKEVLGAAAIPLGWIRKNLELPLASVLTAVFSPGIPWKQGETWLEHQKREYDIWQAPTYVKGAAESLLWFIPYFGWAGKGARVLGASEKVLKAIEKTGKIVTLELPTNKVLDAALYNRDFYRTFALWAKDKPVLHQVVEVLGGQKAFVKPEGEPLSPEDIIRRSQMNNAVIGNEVTSWGNANMYRLKKGDPVKILGIDEDGLVKTAISEEGKSRYIYDILEHPKDYKFATPEAQSYIDEWVKLRQELGDITTKEGIKQTPKVNRSVLGVVDKDGKFLESKWGSDPSLRRNYATQEEAVASHIERGGRIVYDNNPNHIMENAIESSLRQITAKRLTETLDNLGKTAMEKFAIERPEIVRLIDDLTNKKVSAKYALDAAQKMISYQGQSIPGATLNKIERELPDIAASLREGLTLRPESVDKVLGAMARELRGALKMSAKELKFMLRKSAELDLTFKPLGVKPIISMENIETVVRKLNADKSLIAKAVATGYRITAKENKQVFQDFMKTNRDNLLNMVKDTQAQLIPLKAERTNFLRPYKGVQNIYTQERQLSGIPQLARIAKLRGKFYDPKVAGYLEKQYKDVGSKFSRAMGSAGGIMRELIATMDASVLFIQGQFLLGRNPLLWAKTAKQVFEYVVHPQNYAKRMADPVIQSLHNEMINVGMSIAPHEFVEATGVIAKGLGQIPKVGGALQASFKQTYGRAEMLFSAYNQIAKDNMWLALRKEGRPLAEQVVLGRSIERMMGSLSTEVLGIGRTQRDIENAWVFFAPRYTRASFAYMGDVLKGGIAGVETRKSLASLALSGMAMYIGVSRLLEQEPDLNPSSSRFMTIKIGNSHMGVSGTMYSLNRLAASVFAMASDPETRGQLSPLNLSRVDNPFYKYLYSKTSPLTGSLVELIEQKDYFGEPFESPADWAKFIGEKITPITLQQTWQQGGNDPAVFAGGALGLRTFPKSDFELQQEARDKIAIREKGKPFDQLDILDKAIINNIPEVKQYRLAIDKQTVIRGEAVSIQFLERKRELDSAQLAHRITIENLQRAYDDGVIDGVGFKDGVINANIGYGATYEHINSNPKYKEALVKLSEPKNRQFRWELAYDELMNASNQFVDQYGQFDFTRYNQFLDSLKEQYGEADFARAMEKKNLKYAEYPPLFQEYQQAKEILKPYWAIKDRVIKLFGQAYADSPVGQTLISKHRKQMRLQNPELNRAYNKFYAQK